MQTLNSAEEAQLFVLLTAKKAHDVITDACKDLHPSQQILIASRMVSVVHQMQFKLVYDGAQKHINELEDTKNEPGTTKTAP